MKSKAIFLLTALFLGGIVGCSSDKGKYVKQPSDQLTSDVNAAKTEFLNRDPNLQSILASAAGYAIFPSVGKGGLGVGAAAGRGQVFEGGRVYPVGEAHMKQVSIGLQAGGQSFSELIVFQDQATLNNFKSGNLEFSAQTSAVAATAGASAKSSFDRGVMVFTTGESGLMAEAAVGGQKFTFNPYLTPTGQSH